MAVVGLRLFGSVSKARDPRSPCRFLASFAQEKDFDGLQFLMNNNFSGLLKDWVLNFVLVDLRVLLHVPTSRHMYLYIARMQVENL